MQAMNGFANGVNDHYFGIPTTSSAQTAPRRRALCCCGTLPVPRCHVSINSPSEMNMKGGISIQRCLSGKCGVQQNGIDGSQQVRFPLLIYGLPIVLDLGSSGLTH